MVHIVMREQINKAVPWKAFNNIEAAEEYAEIANKKKKSANENFYVCTLSVLTNAVY